MNSKPTFLLANHSLAMQTALLEALLDRVESRVVIRGDAKQLSPYIEASPVDYSKRKGKGRNKGGNKRW